MSVKSVNSENNSIAKIDQRLKIVNKRLNISIVASVVLGISAAAFFSYFVPIRKIPFLNRFNFSNITFKVMQVSLSSVLGGCFFIIPLIVSSVIKKIFKNSLRDNLKIEDLEDLKEQIKEVEIDYCIIDLKNKNLINIIESLVSIFSEKRIKENMKAVEKLLQDIEKNDYTYDENYEKEKELKKLLMRLVRDMIFSKKGSVTEVIEI